MLLRAKLRLYVQFFCTTCSPGLIFRKTHKDKNRQQCNGMYSKSAWGGDTDPFIEAKFIKTDAEGDQDPLVSLVVFEWRDEDLVGVWPSEDAAKVRRNYCGKYDTMLMLGASRNPTFVTMPRSTPSCVLRNISENLFLARTSPKHKRTQFRPCPST